MSTSYGYQAGQFNQLTSTTSASYGYDANGNMATKSEGSNFWRYGWDHENRLVSAATRKQAVKYKYDALGRRIERNLGFRKEQTKFTYDGNDVLIDDDKGTLTKYLNGGGIDNKLRAQTGTAVNYFLADHLGSTNGLTDSTGNISSSSNYDSFGNPSNSAFPSRYQFTGREFDSFTGLQFSRARWYDPRIGRFISEDPIGFEGGDVNMYGYVKNRPIRLRDPSGLDDADQAFYDKLPKGWDRNKEMDPAELQRIERCYQKYKFSSVFSFGNPTAQTILGYVEVGSFSSLTLDSVAIARKASGPSTASSNVYASGINMLGKDASRVIGHPGVFRYVRAFGDKATPVLAITGAGTFAYNFTTDIQCACGFID